MIACEMLDCSVLEYREKRSLGLSTDIQLLIQTDSTYESGTARENAQRIYVGFGNAGYSWRPCLVRSKIETLTTEPTRISLHTCVSNCKYENVWVLAIHVAKGFLRFADVGERVPNAARVLCVPGGLECPSPKLTYPGTVPVDRGEGV
jgi:hypothetical protein